MRQTKALFLIGLLAACLSRPAQAQPVITAAGPGNFFIYRSTGGGFPPPLPVIIPPLLMGMQAAHLTADQQNQVNQILRSNRSQTAPLVQQLQSIHEQIADKLLATGTVSDLAPLEDQAARLDAQIQQQALNASVQIRAILTSDQVARMAQFHQKMAALQAQMESLMSETSQQPVVITEPTP
jgi:ferredoxin-NADP reductase